MRRRLAASGAGLLFAGGAVVSGVWAASADAVGWWQRGATDAGTATSTTAVPVPVPVTAPAAPVQSPPAVDVPEGGMYVAGEVSGPRAVSALRFADVEGERALLTLQVAGDPLTADDIPVSACPVAGSWEPAVNGAWDERPELDCQIGIGGDVSDDGTEVRFELPFVELYRTAGGIEIGIAPLFGDTTPFAVAFEAPAADALEVAPPDDDGGGDDDGDGGGDDDSGDDDGGGFLPPRVTPGGGTLPSFDDVPDGPADLGDGSIEPVARRGPSSAGALTIGTHGVARAVLTVLLAALAAVAWTASGGRLPFRRPASNEGASR